MAKTFIQLNNVLDLTSEGSIKSFLKKKILKNYTISETLDIEEKF